MDGARAEDGVRGAAREPCLEPLEGDEDVPRLRDRVDPEVRPGAVRRAAEDLDVEPDEALVRDHHLEVRGLGDDRRVGA